MTMNSLFLPRVDLQFYLNNKLSYIDLRGKERNKRKKEGWEGQREEGRE